MALNIKPRKQWGKKLVGSAVGATAACFMAPVLAGALSAGVTGMIVTGVATGGIGSSLTRITYNVIDADDIQEMVYNPHSAQQHFRTAIENFLEAVLDPAFDSIRRNLPYDSEVTLQPQLRNALRILNTSTNAISNLTIRIIIHVRPRPGTTERDLAVSVGPRDLPVFQQQATQTFPLPREPDTLLTGVARSAIGGMLGGAAFGPAIWFIRPLQIFHWFPTVPHTNVGVLLGAPTATGIIGALGHLGESPDHMETLAAYVDFAAELNRHFNRLKECGNLNGVDVSYNVTVNLEHSVNVAAEPVRADGRDAFQYNFKVD